MDLRLTVYGQLPLFFNSMALQTGALFRVFSGDFA